MGSGSALDSTPDALATQREVWRRIGPAGRVRLAIQMSEEARRISLAGLRSRDPALGPREAQSVLVRQLYGIEPPPRDPAR